MSIVNGVIIHRRVWRVILRTSILFGVFQALMPFIGWLGTNYFSEYIEAIDHWIAFGLLVFLGGRMIKESFEDADETHLNPEKIKTQMLLAVATSIDALAVGISFACLGYRNVSQLAWPLAIIGVTSFVMGVLGSGLGIKFGRAIERKLRPELVGGVILVFIGMKILLSHLDII